MFRVNEKKQDKKLIEYFMNQGFSRISSVMLINRGCINMDDATRMFMNDTKNLHSYKLLPDIEKAVSTIRNAITSKEKIVIFGDYDADGITSVALLYSYLQTKTDNLELYIPDRNSEGYGMNMKAVEKLAKEGVKLIITVDNGINAFEEIDYAYSLGMKCIVTDHHRTMTENDREIIPGCEAVVNPMRNDSVYPFKNLAGVGVAYKLVCALEEKEYVEEYIDLAAIGTVSDLMPIKDENRIIVSKGLEKIKNNPATWCKIFFEIMGLDLQKSNSGTIAYQLAPRINAAGRLGDTSIATNMFLNEYINEIKMSATKLCEINEKRKIKEREILKNIDPVQLLLNKDKIIIELIPDLPTGLTGIIASRLVEICNKPTILFSKDGDDYRGSARSVNGINIFDLISKCSIVPSKFGGHAAAAGLTIKKEDFEEFKKELVAVANQIDDDLFCKNVDVECEIFTDDMTIENVKAIQKFEPYGESNPEPFFYFKNVLITDIIPIGRGRFLKLVLQDRNGGSFSAVSFNLSQDTFPCYIGDRINIICNIKDDYFGGVPSVSCVIRYIEDCKIEDGVKASIARNNTINKYQHIKDHQQETDLVISREDVVSLYKYIRRGYIMTDEHSRSFSFNYITRYLDGFMNEKEPEIKLLFVLDVLKELGQIDYSLVGYNGASEDIGIDITFNNPVKTDLSNSNTYMRFNNQV